MIRNLKTFGADENDLLEVFIQQIRSITATACPVWNTGITQQEERAWERVQRTDMAVIWGDSHTNYNEALDQI